MRRPPALPIGVAALAAVTGLSLVAPAVAQAAPRAPKFAFTASAYGTHASVGSLVTSSNTGSVALGCTSAPGTTRSNSSVGVNLPGVLSSGTTATSVSSTATSATSSSNTQGVSLLGGLVSADAVKSVSTTSYDTATKTFSTSGEGSEFVNLSVGGQSISGTPKANTKITLPGIGFVLLNQQGKSNANGAGLTVQAININVTQANDLVPVGLHVLVSSAKSGLFGPVAGTSHGSAYSTYATVGSTVTTARTFATGLACTGDETTVRTRSGVGTSIPGVLSTGTLTNSAQGTIASDPAFAHLTSSVQNVNLLGGILHVGTVNADVTTSGTNDNGTPTNLVDNSSFVGLQIAGLPALGDNVAPNTQISPVPGITLTLHKVEQTVRRVSVTMIELKVTGFNTLGLANGTVIDIGNASVSGL